MKIFTFALLFNLFVSSVMASDLCSLARGLQDEDSSDKVRETMEGLGAEVISKSKFRINNLQVQVGTGSCQVETKKIKNLFSCSRLYLGENNSTFCDYENSQIEFDQDTNFTKMVYQIDSGAKAKMLDPTLLLRFRNKKISSLPTKGYIFEVDDTPVEIGTGSTLSLTVYGVRHTCDTVYITNNTLECDKSIVFEYNQ